MQLNKFLTFTWNFHMRIILPKAIKYTSNWLKKAIQCKTELFDVGTKHRKTKMELDYN